MSGERDADGLGPDSGCDEILQRVYPFLDHELDAATAAAIWAHVEGCEHCMDDFDAALAVKNLVNRCCRAEQAPPQLRVTILTSITRWRAG